jgi:hypothetical protein
MLTLSKPISAGQAQAYHRSEFANAKENYYTEGERVRGVWQGQLAERWGLRGEVNEEQFARLSEGQHPATGEALVRRQQAREYVNVGNLGTDGTFPWRGTSRRRMAPASPFGDRGISRRRGLQPQLIDNEPISEFSGYNLPRDTMQPACKFIVE